MEGEKEGREGGRDEREDTCVSAPKTAMITNEQSYVFPHLSQHSPIHLQGLTFDPTTTACDHWSRPLVTTIGHYHHRSPPPLVTTTGHRH